MHKHKNTFDGRSDKEIAEILRANVRALEEMIQDAEAMGLSVELDFDSKTDPPHRQQTGPEMIVVGQYGDMVDDSPLDFYDEFSTLYLEIWRCV
jgi:hypothetical protein